LLEEVGLDFVRDIAEGGIEPFVLVKTADARLDGGGFAETGKELIRGEALGFGLIDLGFPGEDAEASVKSEDRVPNPSVGENFLAMGFGGHGGKRVAW
jgi:hypothetical protein